jgi:hypothetical protein
LTAPSTEVTVCRDPSGSIACKQPGNPDAGKRWGYDCCVQGFAGYLCYWFGDVPRPPIEAGPGPVVDPGSVYEAGLGIDEGAPVPVYEAGPGPVDGG